ncbi:hypothetical protein NC653_038938 [Populus alba x Populus x berolinensis]|uniref:Uncharacterized protein n=1 Tax=Populus alba x Populus x berolinensis TaxID=444605 RepID=A0AAD6PQS5_9ROSI|nr:hypothetical protein NC653_038938 [Populus alba x Populus x berolinensis]
MTILRRASLAMPQAVSVKDLSLIISLTLWCSTRLIPMPHRCDNSCHHQYPCIRKLSINIFKHL